VKVDQADLLKEVAVFAERARPSARKSSGLTHHLDAFEQSFATAVKHAGRQLISSRGICRAGICASCAFDAIRCRASISCVMKSACARRVTAVARLLECIEMIASAAGFPR